jgi:hypothetical protein
MTKSQTFETASPANASRRSNFDRLSGQLKVRSLASQLLDVWMAGDALDVSARMRAVLDAETTKTQESDALAPSPQT